MKKDCENFYGFCREIAGFTPVEASELLHISTRRLWDYENNKAPVPDDIVASMAKEYNAPLLAVWHLKKTSVLGEFLPDVVMPRTDGDMAFQLVQAEDELQTALDIMKKLLKNGKIDPDEWDDFANGREAIDRLCDMTFSIATYAKQREKEKDRPAGTGTILQKEIA